MKNKFAVLILCASLIFILANNSFAQTGQTFTNPILSGFYPDPSICKVGDNFYLVNSTFAYFPGITIFHGKDLVNWELIGHVLDKPEQLNLDGQGVSRGIFAPAIRYDDGIFYVTCTLVDIGGNFVATSKSPEGPWSNPVWLPEIDGIDPSLFFDDNGKAYLIYNSIPPEDKPLYDGHRTIRMREFDKQNLKVIGDEKILINGGVDINKKPVWIEGPHIYKVNGYYYLLAAEGGTADQHSEVIFRSENVNGPYLPYKNNPILTQRNLNPDRSNPITSTGHADFVQTNNTDWWAVFLGCRPYSMKADGYYNTGRETFLAPVRWIKDSTGVSWPVINPDYDEVQYFYPLPLPTKKLTDRSYSGNVFYRDDFCKNELDKNWMFLRTPLTKWYDLSKQSGFISLKLRPETCSGKSNPSFLGYRQQNIKCSASTSIKFNPKSENEKAGLLIFQNENHFYLICKSLESDNLVIQLYKSLADSSNEQLKLVASQIISEEENEKQFSLMIKSDEKYYSFYYSFVDKPEENKDWILLKENMDVEFLSTHIAGGFVGCVFGMYATSNSKPSENEALFDFFEYQANDEIYQTK